MIKYAKAPIRKTEEVFYSALVPAQIVLRPLNERDKMFRRKTNMFWRNPGLK